MNWCFCSSTDLVLNFSPFGQRFALADEELSFKAPPVIQAVGLKKKPLGREAHLAVIAKAPLKGKGGNTMEINEISEF